MAGRIDGVFYLINLAIKAVRSGICGYIAVARSIVLNIMPLSEPTRQNSKEFLEQNKSMRPNDLSGFGEHPVVAAAAVTEGIG